MGHSSGKIFLSEQRGQIQSSVFQRNCTFNFDSYFHEHKAPLRSLYVFNEENLLAGAKIKMKLDRPSYIVLIPVTGDLQYMEDFGTTRDIPVGQMMVRKSLKDASFELQNPYNEEAITFIQILIADETELTIDSIFDVNPGAAANQLVELCPNLFPMDLPFKLSMGQFDGRAESIYHTMKWSNQVFCYVIAGAFEIEGRLLHTQDGIALWDTQTLDLEALSNNALILTIETS